MTTKPFSVSINRGCSFGPPKLLRGPFEKTFSVTLVGSEKSSGFITLALFSFYSKKPFNPPV